MTTLPPDQTPNYAIANGGGSAYAVSGVPYSVLIGSDGKVVYEGSPGGISEKVIEAELKKVKTTPEAAEARAGKREAFAEKFAEDKLFARAEYELTQVTTLYPSTEAAKKAKEKLATFAEGDTKAELDAQKEVAKMVGLGANFEKPADKLKDKEMEAVAKKLTKKAEELRAKTPRAAKMAEEWAGYFTTQWKDLSEEGEPINTKDKGKK